MPLSADIVFIVDSSFDVSVENYQKEKEFVKSLVKTLYLAPGKSRGSVIISDRIVIRLDDHSNSTTFDAAVDDLRYSASLRRMDLGLQQSVAALRDARPGIPTVVILLTAGRQNSSRYRLGESVKPLKNLGSKVFVVSIGSRPDDQELLPVVERPNDIIRVSAFDDLTSETRTIARHIVNRTGMKRVHVFVSHTACIYFVRIVSLEKFTVASTLVTISLYLIVFHFSLIHQIIIWSFMILAQGKLQKCFFLCLFIPSRTTSTRR